MDQSSEFPQWDAADPGKSLMQLYHWTIQKAQERIDWYEGKRKPKRYCSQGLRGLSIILAAIGGLCPLIDATGLWGVGKVALGQWGYVFIAAAAAMVGFDRFFGVSSGWMRFMLTQLSLERSLLEIQYDWAILSAQPAGKPPEENIPAMLKKLKDFSLQVENLVKQETDAWVAEFQSEIAELDKILKTEAETRKVGNIKVNITNAKDFDNVSICLNAKEIKILKGVSEGLIDAIPPGRYEIIANAKKDSKEFKESKVVEVQPNSMASVEMTLKSP